jgi:predicted lipoprotein with Yx(FWY)xxD motif
MALSPRTSARAAVPAALAMALVLAACSSSSKTSTAGTTTTTAGATTSSAAATSTMAETGDVRVAQTKLGKVLVDAEGRTLYLFTKDTSTTQACTGTCAQAWPPLTATGTPTAGPGVTGTLTVVKRADGTSQVVIDGHPLYTFVGDSATGDTKGQEVEGLWYAVTPSGEKAGDST